MTMPRAAASFKQTILTRAIKAALAAGLEVRRTEITMSGETTLINLFHRPEITDEPAKAALNAWRARRDARSS
jgi:hypothetical protein